MDRDEKEKKEEKKKRKKKRRKREESRQGRKKNEEDWHMKGWIVGIQKQNMKERGNQYWKVSWKSG